MALLTPMEQSPCPACAWLNVQFLIWANKMYIFVLSQWNLNLENIYINIQQNVCKTKLSIYVHSPQHRFEFTYCELGLPGWLQELNWLSRGCSGCTQTPFCKKRILVQLIFHPFLFSRFFLLLNC